MVGNFLFCRSRNGLERLRLQLGGNVLYIEGGS